MGRKRKKAVTSLSYQYYNIAQGEGSLNENTVTFSTKGSNKITYQLDEPMKVGAEETYLIEWDQYLGTDIDGTGELNGYNGQFLSMSNAVLGGGFKKITKE